MEQQQWLVQNNGSNSDGGLMSFKRRFQRLSVTVTMTIKLARTRTDDARNEIVTIVDSTVITMNTHLPIPIFGTLSLSRAAIIE
jgi:hypothetical protein